MLNLFNFVQLVRKLVSASLFEMIPRRSSLCQNQRLSLEIIKCSYGLISNLLMCP